MNESNKLAIIEKMFPKGHVTRLAGRYNIGKTMFATDVARLLSLKGERVIYFNNEMYLPDMNSMKCYIFDIAQLSIDEIEFILSKHDYLDTAFIDNVELVDYNSSLDRANELKEIWQSLECIARKRNLRIIGVSELHPFRIDGSENIQDDKLKYLKFGFPYGKMFIVHRSGFYTKEGRFNSKDMQQIDLIELDNTFCVRSIEQYDF